MTGSDRDMEPEGEYSFRERCEGAARMKEAGVPISLIMLKYGFATPEDARIAISRGKKYDYYINVWKEGQRRRRGAKPSGPKLWPKYDEMMLKLWDEGLPTTLIARRIEAVAGQRVTKNHVIGRHRRLVQKLNEAGAWAAKVHARLAEENEKDKDHE